jgi:hypothetical protein
MTFSLLLILILAVSLAQIPNVSAQQFLHDSPSLIDVIKLTLLISPVALAACSAFIFYFNHGGKVATYSTLTIISLALTILASAFIQVITEPNAALKVSDFVGGAIILAGIGIIIMGPSSLNQ